MSSTGLLLLELIMSKPKNFKDLSQKMCVYIYIYDMYLVFIFDAQLSPLKRLIIKKKLSEIRFLYGLKDGSPSSFQRCWTRNKFPFRLGRKIKFISS